jgi:hypothetical protein
MVRDIVNRDQDFMDKIFNTCCTIYNQKMRLQGANEEWELNFTLENIEDDVPSVFTSLSHTPQVELPDALQVDDFREPPPINEILGHDKRKGKLINHFAKAYNRREVYWIRNGKASHLYNPFLL